MIKITNFSRKTFHFFLRKTMKKHRKKHNFSLFFKIWIHLFQHICTKSTVRTLINGYFIYFFKFYQKELIKRIILVKSIETTNNIIIFLLLFKIDLKKIIFIFSKGFFWYRGGPFLTPIQKSLKFYELCTHLTP